LNLVLWFERVVITTVTLETLEQTSYREKNERKKKKNKQMKDGNSTPTDVKLDRIQAGWDEQKANNMMFHTVRVFGNCCRVASATLALFRGKRRLSDNSRHEVKHPSS
jgi:hypothetical protein